MDKNNLIGFLLIMGIVLVMSIMNTPSKEEVADRTRVRDSILTEQRLLDSIGQTTPEVAKIVEQIPDSVRQAQLAAKFGSSAESMTGTADTFMLENDVFKVKFTNKGGKIASVELKKYQKLEENEQREDIKTTLYLLNDKKNKFEYLLKNGGNEISTSDLYFTSTKSINSIRFTADVGNGRQVIQEYTLSDTSYLIDYKADFVGMPSSESEVDFYWETHLESIEKNSKFEKNFYSTMYYKLLGDKVKFLNRRKSKEKELEGTQVKWVSHAQQFFNTTLIADDKFIANVFQSEAKEDGEEGLKVLKTGMKIPVSQGVDRSVVMSIYTGPNEFNTLKSMGHKLQEVVPFGYGLFGSINRWIVRPLFNFLLGLFSSKGLVIILLTFLVKFAVYPLTYKMLKSQAKMAALKPQLAGLKEKFKDDSQKVQMETMKAYREYGVNPLGGCLPMVLQMPIWIALYRFFPASIEFRQAEFLWANDLSSFDAFFKLPFELPMGLGSHLSLFTLLWAITTLIYTYYNTKHMDMSANPAMKWMQYLMPLMFLGFFNGYASGLTCYLLFSNIFTIGQTLGTRAFIFDDDKILAELNIKKAKPKKKGGFQERLQKAMGEQQRLAADREKTKKKK